MLQIFFPFQQKTIFQGKEFLEVYKLELQSKNNFYLFTSIHQKKGTGYFFQCI